MKKWDKVILKDLKYSEFRFLNDEMKETYDMDFNEEGIILNAVVDNMAVVAFPRGIDTVNVMYLELIKNENNVYIVEQSVEDDCVEVNLFKNEEDAQKFADLKEGDYAITKMEVQ